jgi:hypothetical protein
LAVQVFGITDATAKEKLSGKNLVGIAIYYSPESITSYGRIVTGQTVIKHDDPDNEKYSASFEKHLLLCKSDELLSVGVVSERYKKSGEWIETIEREDSSDQVRALARTINLSDSGGLGGFHRELRSKCSGNIAKLPKLEIPVAKSDDVVFHAILSTYRKKAGLTAIWMSRKKFEKIEKRNSRGEKMIVLGQTLYNYKIIKDFPRMMVKLTFNCERGEYAELEGHSYDSTGKITDSYSFDIKSAKFLEPIPDSIGENILDFVCKL